jgi:hypothetical protein
VKRRETFRTVTWPAPDGNSACNGAFLFAMQDSQQYRSYAEDCKRLARQVPSHRDALLKIADAWLALAEQAEQGNEGDGEIKK